MNKFWLVFKNEYLRHVRRKRFIYAVLSMPLFVGLTIGIGFLAVAIQYNGKPIGYVDQSGFLAKARQVPNTEKRDLFPDPQVIPFPDELSARHALDIDEVQGYYVVSKDYLADGKVNFVAKKSGSTDRVFMKFLKYNLLNDYPQDTALRIINGPTIIAQSLNGSRSMGGPDIVGMILPLISGILLMIAINTSGGYLVQALVEEKENRTMEIVVTSVSPEQLMAGKILGNLSVGLTELFIWIISGIILLVVSVPELPFLSGFAPNGQYVFLLISTMILAFILIAALMSMVGATATDVSEAQQVAGLFTLPTVIPFWFMQSLMEAPNSPLSIGLSMFPLTAPVSLPLRSAYTDIPAFQVILALGLLILFSVAALWLAARAFRLGMLRYGKRLSLREIFGKA